MKCFNKIIVAAVLVLTGLAPLRASNPFAHDTTTHADIDPVIVSLDSMSYQLFTRDKFFGNTEQLSQSIALTRDQLPSYTPEEMKRRMKMIPSMISMDYNADVAAFIDFFVYRRRDLMTKLLASSQIYFPLFEEVLDKNNMPDELKYLPLIESALNPQAVSSAGATGLWQMMYGTGKLMGLDGNSYYDERRDPVKSTIAGVKYLKQLYDMYGDWQLALAAYNSGPGYVNKAIARAGGVKNFWAIKNMLPAETRSYVPTFLAMVYAIHYHSDYKLVSAEPKRELYAVDTVNIQGKVTLKHIASTLGMPVDELQFLNPGLKLGIVPALANGYPLNIPINYFATFESKKDVLMNDPEINAQTAASDQYANPTMVRVAKYIYYKVRKSDNLNAIAARYGVSLSELREWNHLKNNYIVKGQNLKILTFPEVPVYQGQQASVAAPAQQVCYDHDSCGDPVATAMAADGSSASNHAQTSNTITTKTGAKTAATAKPAVSRSNMSQISATIKYYRVQQGDSLWSITQHYPGLTIDKLRSANKISGQGLQKGQVLKIVL